MGSLTVQQENLLSDLSYFKEELHALKKIIPEVPYRDRPMGQDSILDMIAKIGSVQTGFLEPIAVEIEKTKDADSSIPVRNLHGITHYAEYPGFPSSSDSENNESSDVNDLLEHLIQQRQQILDLLTSQAAFPKNRKVILQQGEWMLYDILNEMIIFERKQFKEVADRVLTIETDRLDKTDIM